MFCVPRFYGKQTDHEFSSSIRYFEKKMFSRLGLYLILQRISS